MLTANHKRDNKAIHKNLAEGKWSELFVSKNIIIMIVIIIMMMMINDNDDDNDNKWYVNTIYDTF